GAQVPNRVLAQAEGGAKRSFAMSSPAASPSEAAMTSRSATLARSALSGRDRAVGYGLAGGDAGVELYARAASVGVLQDSVNTNKALVKELRDKAANAKEEPTRREARQQLVRFDEAEKVQKEAQKAVIGRLDDKQFIAGFG